MRFVLRTTSESVNLVAYTGRKATNRRISTMESRRIIRLQKSSFKETEMTDISLECVQVRTRPAQVDELKKTVVVGW
jgi:uncharacterized protein (DUF2384 family)